MSEFDRARMIIHRSRAEQERINRMLSPLDLPAIHVRFHVFMTIS